MATSTRKIHQIIHTAAVSCAAVGAGFAQAPGSDSVVIVPIQTAMISAIAVEHGYTVSKAAAVDLLLTFAATAAGRGVSQVLVGWLPGIGNLVNALTAGGITEAIGWAADEFFSADERAFTHQASV